jgi:hypothetical protein
MPDERQTSTAEGIAPAPESPLGREAERRRREELIEEPVESRPDGGVGGTSDADSPGDEAWTPRPGATEPSGRGGAGDGGAD